MVECICLFLQPTLPARTKSTMIPVAQCAFVILTVRMAATMRGRASNAERTPCHHECRRSREYETYSISKHKNTWIHIHQPNNKDPNRPHPLSPNTLFSLQTRRNTKGEDMALTFPYLGNSTSQLTAPKPPMIPNGCKNKASHSHHDSRQSIPSHAANGNTHGSS